MQVLRSILAQSMLAAMLAAMLAGCTAETRPYRSNYYSAGPPPSYVPATNRPYGCRRC